MARFMLNDMAGTGLVKVLKPRNWLTPAATVAALLWTAPVSAGLVHTLASSHGAAARNVGTISLNQTNTKGTNHVRTPRTRGGPPVTPPPVTCPDSTTTPIIPISDPITPPRQRGGHTRVPKSSSAIALASPAPQVDLAAPATQNFGRTRPTRSSRRSGPPVSTPPVSDPGTCPPLVIDTPPGDPGPIVTPPTVVAAPEPASLLIFGSGIAGIVAYRRRKKKAA